MGDAPSSHLREGNGNPLQYPCPENPTDRGVWWATVQGVAKRHDCMHAETPGLTDS